LENRISVDKRRAQLAPVLAYAQATQLPTVITGDMNTSPFTWAAGVLPFPSAQGCWLEDLARSHGFETPVADSGPTTPYLSMKLDAIYTRGVRVVNYGVESSMHASDHYPLWADMLVVAPQTAARTSI
jgi:endonuclease/exonuclease/phosphatase family metal-dependent hydrolase